MLVFGDGTVQNGKLERLETQQALTNSRIGVRIELPALQIAKELIQSVVSPLAIVSLATIVTLAQSIVNVTI